MEDALGALADRAEISDLLVRYATSLDARDWDGLRTCFTEDAVTDYGPHGSVNNGRDAIVETCRLRLAGLDSSHHLIGNLVIEVNGSVGTAQCYVHAQRYLVGPQGLNTSVVGGIYRDRLVRTDAGWRIVHRTLETTWTDGNAGISAEGESRLRRDRGGRPAAQAGS